MTRERGEERKPRLNRGVELMLRSKKKKKEEPSLFSFVFAKMVSLFYREFHFRIEFHIRKKLGE